MKIGDSPINDRNLSSSIEHHQTVHHPFSVAYEDFRTRPGEFNYSNLKRGSADFHSPVVLTLLGISPVKSQKEEPKRVRS